ncbi:MAG: S8 family serine peptidase [Thermoleophilaceae bacterium]
MRSRTAARIALGYLAVAIVAGTLASLGGGEKKPLTPAQKRAKRADVGGPFPLELRSPQVVAGTAQRVLVALGRPSLGELTAHRRQSPSEQRAYVRSLHREELALISALEAKGVHFGEPILFARVWSGFSATIATKDLPAVQTLGLRVEPVSRFYPAQVAAKTAPAVRPLPTIAKQAIRVAVIDAFPRGRAVQADFVRRGGGRSAPGEAAGPRIASVVQSELPSAEITRLRAAGNQALETGKFEVFATTDQLIAALERSVDPDQNGDAADAFSVAVTGLSAPFSGFAQSPAAAAVDAAARLGTLVVAAAGNGGESGGPYGTVGAPGAAAGALTVGALDGSGKVAPASSRGPTYDLTPKPDLAIGGGAKTGAGSAWGTAIAAARVAGVAAALRTERPAWSPEEAAAALVQTAAPRGPLFAAGGGDPLLQAARRARIVTLPWSVVRAGGQTARVRFVNLRRRELLTRGRPIAVVAPPTGGRIVADAASIPFEQPARTPGPPPLGALHVLGRSGRASGVRFTAGSIARAKGARAVMPVGNLVLTLEGRGRRELTPPGGARDLLPGEYAYTLTAEVLRALPPGRYRFVARARGTAGGPPVVRRSRAFRIR